MQGWCASEPRQVSNVGPQGTGLVMVMMEVKSRLASTPERSSTVRRNVHATPGRASHHKPHAPRVTPLTLSSFLTSHHFLPTCFPLPTRPCQSSLLPVSRHCSLSVVQCLLPSFSSCPAPAIRDASPCLTMKHHGPASLPRLPPFSRETTGDTSLTRPGTASQMSPPRVAGTSHQTHSQKLGMPPPLAGVPALQHARFSHVSSLL